MSSSVDKSSTTQSLFSGQNVLYAGIAWAVIALLFFLLFSINVPGEESPLWYLVGTYVLELSPFLAAAILCYRNWRSPQIASGRNVWLGIGLGTFSYFLGGLLFGWWELFLHLDPAVSPADLFYSATYVFLGWAIVLAVLPRRLNLEIWQWVTVGVIALLGIAFAVWLSIYTAEESDVANLTASTTTAEEVILTTSSPQQSASNQARQLIQEDSSAFTPETVTAQATTAVAKETGESQPPSWALSLETMLDPLARWVNLFYIVGDVFLLIIASTLILAFWGGRFAQSWRMIAAASFCLYIADMWFKYAEATAVEYESGGLLEVFYIFSGVLFAIGAALEYDVSSRSRRGSRRRA
ncbi:MAG: hypothetical protein WA919_14700 [Coleofasciculaceae cyanobacterium]